MGIDVCSFIIWGVHYIEYMCSIINGVCIILNGSCILTSRNGMTYSIGCALYRTFFLSTDCTYLPLFQGRDAYDRFYGDDDSYGRYYGKQNTKCGNCKQKGHSSQTCPWPKVSVFYALGGGRGGGGGRGWAI